MDPQRVGSLRISTPIRYPNLGNHRIGTDYHIAPSWPPLSSFVVVDFRKNWRTKSITTRLSAVLYTFRLHLVSVPKGLCTQIGNTWALKYLLFRDFRARVHHNEVHGPLGYLDCRDVQCHEL